MRHVNLFLAAATIVFGSVTALWADPFPAANSTAIFTRGPGPAPVTLPVDSAPALAVVPAPSPVAGIAAGPGMKGQPEELKSGPIRHSEHLVVPPRRPVTHRARLGCNSSQASARVAERAVPLCVAASEAAACIAAASERQCSFIPCTRYVLLGVGF